MRPTVYIRFFDFRRLQEIHIAYYDRMLHIWFGLLLLPTATATTVSSLSWFVSDSAPNKVMHQGLFFFQTKLKLITTTFLIVGIDFEIWAKHITVTPTMISICFHDYFR